MFKVHYIVSAAALEKLLKATDDIAVRPSNIEHLRQADDPEKIKQLRAPPKTKVKNKRATAGDIILLTNERPRKGSIRDKVVIALEKLEVKHGVGEVTRKMLRERCKTLSLDPQIVNQLTAKGYAVSE